MRGEVMTTIYQFVIVIKSSAGITQIDYYAIGL